VTPSTAGVTSPLLPPSTPPGHDEIPALSKTDTKAALSTLPRSSSSFMRASLHEPPALTHAEEQLAPALAPTHPALAGHSAYATDAKAHSEPTPVNTSAVEVSVEHVALPSASATQTHLSQVKVELEHVDPSRSCSTSHVAPTCCTQGHVCADA